MAGQIQFVSRKWLSQILPKGIRARLFLLITLAVLPLLLLQFRIYEQRYEIRRTDEMQNELEVARGVSNSFGAYIQAIYQQNYVLGTAIINDRSFEKEKVTNFLTRTAAYFPVIRNLNWVNPLGIVLASSQANVVGRDLSIRVYFQKILAGQPLAIGDLTETGIITNAPTLGVATAFRDDQDHLMGVLVAVIEPSRIGELALSHRRPSGGEFSLFDRQGTVVYNSSSGSLPWDERVNWKNQDPLLQGVLQTGQEEIGINSLPISGEDWISARVPVPGTGFVAGAHGPVSIAFDPLKETLIQDVCITIFVGFLAFLLASLVASTISNSIHRLEKDALWMGTGTLKKAEDLFGPLEVRQLRSTVEKMAAELLDRTAILQESEERYKVLFQNLHTPMLVIDPVTATITDANPAACSFYGWEPAEFSHKKITDINILQSEQTQRLMNIAQSVHASHKFNLKHRLANGEIKDVEVHSGPIEIGGKTYLFSIIHDTTPRMRLEAEREQLIAQLEQERARWQGVVEGIADEVWVCDAQGKMSLMNLPAITAMRLKEFKDRTIDEVLEDVEIYTLDGEIRPPEQYPLIRSLRGEIVRGEEMMRNRQTGKIGYRQFSSAPIRNALGEITGSVAIVRDVTEYKRMEESLRQNEAQLRAIFEAMSNAVVVLDRHGKVTQANPAAKETYGFDPTDAELWAKSYPSLAIKRLDGSPVLPEEQVSSRVMRGEKVVGERFLFTGLSGRQSVILASANPIFDENQEFEGAVIVWHDITELEQAEKALLKAHERAKWLARFPNENPNPVMRVSAHGSILYRNPATVAAGWHSKVGQTLAAPFLNLVKQAVTQAKEIQADLKIANRIYSISLLPFQAENYVNIYGQDITERKQAEAALQLSEARLRRLFDTSVIGIMNRDIHGNITDANEALLNLLGYARSDVDAQKLQINHLLPEEYLPIEQRILQETLEEGVSKPYEKEFIRKDGSRVPVLVGHTCLDSLQIEIIGFVIDLTDLKKTQAALEDYSEKLKRSNQELEQFAFVASHDLQEPLRKISFFGESISKKASGSLDEEALDYLERMQNAARRMRGMIQDLLELSRISTHAEAFQKVDLSKVAEDAINDLEGRIRNENGQVSLGQLPVIEADRSQMQRLLQNLIGNGLKYHKEDTPPVVKISGKVNPAKGKQPSFVTLTIEDNGIGFDEQYAERIFQPFQRLHGRSEYEGTGMGLTICQKIVERHHGKISVHSQPGQGSTFIVQLPLRQSDE